MSTLVLARKYRPRNFAEMVGQEHVVQALSNALTQQRLHHAYLFTGTRGVGKTTVSRVLAKSLNCTGADGRGGITAQPCGVCPACRDIDAGRFVDYVELDAASNRGVDEITALLDQSVYKPVLGRFKVYMIDEVHMMTSHAFNAMLKTLEEPPDYLKFVLATTDPQKVPVTVLSRCLQFNLRPMAPETIQQHLQTVLAAEAIAADAGALRLIARNARGSMRDALSLADQAIAFGAGALVEAGVRQMLGAVDRSHVQRIVQTLAASDGAGLVAVVDGLRRLGLSAAGTLEELAAVTQQMALLQALPQAADENDPDTPMLRELAASLAADETQLLYSIALHGRAELALAPDEYSGLTMVLLRALAFRPPGAKPAASIAARGGAAGASVGGVTGAVAGGGAGGVTAGVTPGAPTGVSSARAGPAGPAGPAAAASAPAASSVTAAGAIPRPAAGAAPSSDSAASPATTTGRSRELLRTPALPSVAAVELPAPADGVASARAPASAAMAEPASVRAIASPAKSSREPDSATEEPAWLRADDPPSDADTAAPWAVPVDTPPWDDQPADLAPATFQRGPGAAVARPNRLSAREPLPGTSPQAPSASAEADAAATRVDDPVTGRWVALLQPLFDGARLSGFVRELAWQSQCVVCEGDDSGASTPLQVVLRVARESLRQGPLRERLQAALIEHLGRPVTIEVTPGTVEDSAALREAAARARRQADAEAFVHNHPLVKSLLAAIPGARVLPGSIRPN